ncbi:MAG TPA: ATP-binding protein, partial [Streptosporangiaceae bacterium]
PFRFDLAWLRGLVRERARAAGLTPRQVVDLVLAVGEAAANTVRHAGGQGTLKIWPDQTGIVCEVADRGRASDPRTGQRPPPPGSGGGQGLWVILQACDQVELRSGDHGTVIRMHMHRS